MALEANSYGRRRSLTDRVFFAALCLILVALPWPWGSNTNLARGLLAFAAGAHLLMWIAARMGGLVAPLHLSRAARIALWLWLAWLMYIALQLLPLTPAWLHILSPASLGYHERIADLHTEPLYSLSIAPSQTLQALLDSMALFCLYFLTLALVDTRERIRRVLTVIFFSGLLQALYGIHMTVSGMEYGFWERKTYGLGWATGTFVNRNHFAAYMELTAAAGVGLVLMDLGRWSWAGWRNLLGGFLDLLLSAKFRNRVMLAVVVVGVVLSRSRMGNIALFSALALAGLLYMLLRMRTSLIPALLVFLSLAVVDLWIVSHWFGLEEVIERIEETELETEQRPLVLQDLVPAIGAYARTGAGLGTFAQAYAPFRSLEVKGFYDHAHNEYAEFLIETGVVGLGILGMLVAVHLLHAVRVMAIRRRSIYAAAAFAALMSSFAMLIHGIVEFMLRVPAIAATWVVLLALCAGIRARSGERRESGNVISVT